MRKNNCGLVYSVCTVNLDGKIYYKGESVGVKMEYLCLCLAGCVSEFITLYI